MLSQRVERFEVTIMGEDGTDKYKESGTVIGYKKIISFPETEVKKLEIRITDSRVAPTLSFAGLY